MSDRMPPRWWDDPEATVEERRASRELEALDLPAPVGAQEQIWARIKEPRSRSLRPRLAVATIAVGLALVIGLATQRWVTRGVARIEAVAGDAQTARLDEAPAPAEVGQRLAAGTKVRTGAASRAVVRLDDVGATLFSENTEAVVEERGEAVDLSRGTVIAAVEPRLQRRPFRIVAGDYEVRVIGTLFKVSRPRADAIDVHVDHGIVEVRGRGDRVRLEAGESFSSLGRPVERIAPEAAALLGETTTKPGGREEIQTGNGTAPVEGPAAVGQPRESDETPKRSKRRPRKREHMRKRKARGPAATAQPERSPPAAEPPLVELPPVETIDEQERTYKEARDEGDPARAIALFDAVATSGGPRAEVAAYQAARLARRQSLTQAVARFERLLENWPHGTFAQEARLSIIEASMKLGAVDRALREADAFLAAHPRSERRGEVRFMRAEILRNWHDDCRAAIPEYRAAESSTRRGADAAYFVAWCLMRLNETEAGLEALQLYLRRFPNGRHAAEARRRVEEIEGAKKD